MANVLGKRYICSECGAEVLCTRNGEGAVKCCDREMQLKDAKPLPSAD